MTISATTATKLTEIQLLRTTTTTFPFPFPFPFSTCYSHSSLHLFYHSSKPSLLLLKTFSSLHTPRNSYPWDLHDDDHPHKNPNASKPKPAAADDSWLNKWTTPTPNPNPNPPTRTRPKDRAEAPHSHDKREDCGSARPSAIERIVHRLRNLGQEEDDENEGEEREAMPVTGEDKLGDLLTRDWVRPDKMLVEEVEEDDGEEESWLPWERVVGREQQEEGGEAAEGDAKKKRTVKAPTLAELTIEDSELRRLRRLGIPLREKVSVPKAGITGAVLEKIHQQWRESELVRLKFHESLAHDMRTAHEIVEVGGSV